MKKISILVPCYNEEQSLPLLYPELKKLMDSETKYNWEVLFVNDGSKDNTLSIIKALRSADKRINYVIRISLDIPNNQDPSSSSSNNIKFI